MDLPQPPEDNELRTIIDKLAQFVARIGPDFEQMTKIKQKGNPKFQFLYGGEYFNYYQYKVTTEQAIVNQQQQQQQQPTAVAESNSWNTPPPNIPNQRNIEIDHIIQQQDALREQIKQSEQNLTAQHTVLSQQQQAAAKATVSKCETEDLQKEADECGINLNDLYAILQPIIDSCTKDSISNGKSWFLQNADNKAKSNCIVQCLLYKVLQYTTFAQKLHVIYLVNDLLHHSARKNANDLKDALEVAVVPMFCNANIVANADQKQKLEKLLKLWESKVNYLQSETLEKLHNPEESFQQYQADQMAKYASKVSTMVQQIKTTFERYQSQHQAFVCHAMQQITDLEQQKQSLEQNQQQQQQQPQQQTQQQPNQAPPATNNIIPLETIQATLQQTIQTLSQSTAAATNQTPSQQTFPIATQNNADSYLAINPSVPPPNLATQPAPINGMDNPFSQPPPGYFPPSAVFPDFSKPPPGFTPKPEVSVDELMPSAPYYDLPAGLMVPLVKKEDTAYRPLDPKDIRLPPPAPPTKRLLAVVEAFYSQPCHERPRDSEGWEKLGLYEYYKAKSQAKAEKEEAIKAGLRAKSKSPSPVVLKSEKENTPPKRRYRSKSPTPPPPVRRRGRRSRSRSRSRTRSRSRSPRRRRTRDSRDSRENRRRRSYTRSRSKSRSPPARRSISPATPNFGGGLFGRNDPQELDPSNKGHEMLRKMGWAGRGLGVKEQGIDSPIAGGDIRDRQDQFKGVGCNLNDPYENFRKNKGAAFITRMKARAEEREKERRGGSEERS
ncbi:hypothetical protein GWI33_007591 [Rhynchophorus ferrugineus]|uniref:Calcium homeostasis endoplasmic reticulum protein n=1 Tax=Rhynchophorus ferrugineus TaxID=354439 RepID=A0A834IDC9_RHYFE|nr:hypothetical protein GWI33_007591 [Rhynchophorus ferrugineus]